MPRRYHVDAGQARLVASAFLDSPRISPGSVVRAAYAALAAQADRWFDRVVGGGARTPIRVVYTRCAEPYATGRELAQRVLADRVLELWPARYDRDRAHPLLDTSIGGAYDRFRAVHDIVSHVGFGYGFDRDGEFSAWLAEDRIYAGIARWALATELHAEHSVLWSTGTVADHKAILLPRDLLLASYQRARRCCP